MQGGSKEARRGLLPRLARTGLRLAGHALWQGDCVPYVPQPLLCIPSIRTLSLL